MRLVLLPVVFASLCGKPSSDESSKATSEPGPSGPQPSLTRLTPRSPVPWSLPCRVPVERKNAIGSRLGYVLETTRFDEQVRFARRHLEPVEVRPDSEWLAEERQFPDVLIAADGTARAAPAEGPDAGLLEAQAVEEWMTAVGAWRDTGPDGESHEDHPIFRSEGVRRVKVVRAQVEGGRKHTFTVENRDLMDIGWVRVLLSDTLPGSNGTSEDPRLDEKFVSGQLSVTYEITFASDGRRPGRTRWSYSFGFKLTGGMAVGFGDSIESTFDWSRAEGCE